MINFSAINKNVQETLFDRMSMLERDSSVSDIGVTTNYPIGSTISTSGGDTRQNYMFARSVFMRMISLTPPVKPDGSIAKPIVLMGGEAVLRDGQYGIAHNLAGSKEFVQQSYIDQYDKEWKEGELSAQGQALYNQLGKQTFFEKFGSAGIRETDAGIEILEPKTKEFTNQTVKPGKYYTVGETQPFRPMPGVKDLSVEFKGGGMTLGATREAEINWTCWTWGDLDRMMPHFLHHGKTVFIDWGWSGVGELQDIQYFNLFKEDGSFRETNDKGEPVDILGELQGHILKQNGNYDALLGVVKDFTWQVRDDGGFDCTTTLVSTGTNILKQTLKTMQNPSLKSIPLLFTDVTTKTWAKNTQTENEEVQKFLKGKDKDKDLMKAYSPYFSFDLYLQDLRNQIISNLRNNKEVLKSGQILAFNSPFDHKVYDPNNEGAARELDGDLGISGTHLVAIYVTWGWFEDNVLSRFFSRVVKSGILGVFRSIENIPDKSQGQSDIEHPAGAKKKVRHYKERNWAKDNTFDKVPGSHTAWDDYENWKDEESKKIRRSVRIRGSKSTDKQVGIITTDTAKFLIFGDNEGSGFRRLLKETGTDRCNCWWEQLSKEYDPNASIDPDYPGSDLINTGYGLTEDEVKKIPVHSFVDPDNPNDGILRNVYFNINYLKEKMEGHKVINDAILNVWKGFSDEYGGIYNFKIDTGDDGNTIMVKDMGWTANSVKGMLDNISSTADADAEDGSPESVNNYEGLFVFPTWEKSSVVKSQNLTAKIPNRMQLAAMYGSQNAPDSISGSADVADYDERAGMAWGRLTAPLDERKLAQSNMTKAQLSLRTLKDSLSGDLEYPFKLNRSFGNADASISDALTIDHPQDGVKIYDTILDPLIWLQRSLLITQQKEIAAGLTKKEINEIANDRANQEKEDAIKELEKKKKVFDHIKKQGIYNNFSLYRAYGTIQVGRGSSRSRGSQRSAHLIIDPTYRQFLISELKGDDGIVGKHDPLIPIEFEIDVDGIAGIYPGNAFQSSYLPTRYKQMACFQALGVDHKIDSSGWSSTIKGQIRVSVETQIEENKTDEEEKFEETKDWTPTESPGRPNIPFPSNLDVDILGDMDFRGLMGGVGGDYSKLEEPPPYVASDHFEDMELRRTDEWDPSDLEVGYVGGGPNLDADFSNIDVDTPPPPLGDLSGNPFPDYQVPIGTPKTMADFGLSINTPSIAELPSQIGVVLQSQSWIPNALLQTVENYISDTLSIDMTSDGQSMVIMINEFGQSSGTISEAMAGLTNTISTFANNHELTTSLTNQIIGLMDDPNNPGVQIYVELTQGGD